MKYLKRFNENIEEKLYQEIPDEVYEDECVNTSTSKPMENFTKEERRFIIQMAKDAGYYLEMSDIIRPHGQLIPEPEKWDYFFTLYKRKGDDAFLQCYKSHDEWFYVAYSVVYWECDYYKCDSWDGLLQFLNDKKIIEI
jgi:hypothetical protein